MFIDNILSLNMLVLCTRIIFVFADMLIMAHIVIRDDYIIVRIVMFLIK